MLRCLGIATLLIAGRVEPGAAQERTTAPASVTPPACGSWGAPRPLSSASGTPVYVETPSIVQRRDETLLLGSPAVVWATDTAMFVDTGRRDRGRPRLPVGVALSAAGTARALPLLPFSALPLMPLGVADGDGTTVVWATSVDSSQPQSMLRDALWTSTLRGDRWSTPQLLWRSSGVRWLPAMAAFIRSGDTPFLAVSAIDTSRRPDAGIALLWRERATWRTRWIGSQTLPPSAVTAQAEPDGSVVLAGVGGLRGSAGSISNAVFAIRLGALQDSAAARPLRIRELGRVPVAGPVLLRFGGATHLLWRERHPEPSTSDSLLDAVSRDGGRTWSEPRSVALGGRYRDPSVWSDGRTASVAMVDERTADVVVFDRADSGWTSSPHRFRDARSLPRLASMRGRDLITYGVTRGPSDEQRRIGAPVLMIATRPSCADPLPPRTVPRPTVGRTTSHHSSRAHVENSDTGRVHLRGDTPRRVR